jgi:two-component system sensor histidine kinase DctS
MQVQSYVETPFRAPVFDRMGRNNTHSEVLAACTTARRISGPAYNSSYFVPSNDGLGVEVMELCLPLPSAGKLAGYLVATYALQEVLDGLVAPQTTRNYEISFTEGDGTRLALRGFGRRGNRVFTARQLLDLPGTTLVLRIDSWRGAPDLFPNVLTALVTAMSIALVSVLALLGKDMRRRFKVEHDLAEALAFRKAMEDSLVTGMRARDLDGRITYVNPAFCQMVGFPAHELLGLGIPAPYWPPEYVAQYQRMQVIRLAGNSPPREGFESVFMRKDGSRFPVLIIEAPLIDAQGVQSGWMGAFLDISEQRRVEELSRTSQERLQATARLATVGEMASLLSHELNQPLAAISGYAAGSLNLLRQGSQSATEFGSDLTMAMQRIAEQAERAGKVIRSVHDFVRRRDQVREAVAPQALLDDILPLVNLQARKLLVRVQIEVEPDLSCVLCDRTMVEQVLLNLARNAMQSMDLPQIAQRVLLLRVRRVKSGDRKKWIEFSVADIGIGIAPEVQQQLFNPFFTTKAEGMGLGLSLCRTVVEQHGGALVFEPNVPQGTVFIFTLPASAVT